MVFISYIYKCIYNIYMYIILAQGPQPVSALGLNGYLVAIGDLA